LIATGVKVWISNYGSVEGILDCSGERVRRAQLLITQVENAAKQCRAVRACISREGRADD